MYSDCQVTVGIIFMNPLNYQRFLDSLESILKNRFFSIKLILIDNTGSNFFTFSGDNNLYRSAIRTDTKESVLGRFGSYIVPADEFAFYGDGKIRSVAENWNLIYKHSDSPVVIFCNDDILVNQYYDKLIYDKVFGNFESLSRDRETMPAVCSFPEVYPVKELVDREWNFESCRASYTPPRGITSIMPGFNGACWGTRRTVLEEVAKKQVDNKPFDERYKLACYEDLDFYKVATGMGYDFNLCYDSFIFHYGASTRNSKIMDELQKKHTEGLYHIDYNRTQFLNKWKMSLTELEEFEKDLYKGWNDPMKNHSLWHEAQELLKEDI